MGAAPLWLGVICGAWWTVDGFESAGIFLLVLEIANVPRCAPSEDEGEMALAFVSEDSESVLLCTADDEGIKLALVDRGKPPDANRARVGDGGEVEALRGERDRGAMTLLGNGVGELSCLGAEVAR